MSHGMENSEGSMESQRLKITTGDATVEVPDDPTAGKKSQAKVVTHLAFFSGEEDNLTWPERRQYDEFTFGYCLTVHKAQGSQWDNVYLFDESFVFREDRKRWLYTGITRASEKITVVT